jgi:hypothetical protein
MGRFAFVVVALFALVLADSPSRGDTPQPALPSSARPEPITGTPAVSAPGSEQPARDPFQPYSIGEPGTKGWDYQSLSPSEKAYVDRNRNQPRAKEISNAFAAATKERAHRAASDSAAHQLGLVDDFGNLGVVR